MRAVLDIVLLVLQIYIWLLIAAAVLSWLIAFNVVNTRNQVVAMIADMLYRLTEPLLRPIRSMLPNLGGIDVSPVILILLIFSKYFYIASMVTYLTFYMIEKFHVSVQQAQIYLFIFLFSVAAGTLLGGPLGDRFGRKYVIWFSILGAAPFTLLLPHVGIFWTAVLSVVIGIIIASAFSAILVYAQELLPGKVGLISGLFFGLAFGFGGLGSAALGVLADHKGIIFVYQTCSFLPLIGILTGFLPNIGVRNNNKV